MKPDIVVDVGNSRIKWGLCSLDGISSVASLPANNATAWQNQLEAWQCSAARSWVVTGVAPQRRDTLAAWLLEQGHTVEVLDAPADLPLQVHLERPDHVGIDRLLNAVAANGRRPREFPAIIVDAGSAVTVDLVDAAGAFCGGAIFPGLRLMTQALHAYTALLPAVELTAPCPPLPGRSTRAAIEAGVFWAVAGGINALSARMAGAATPVVFLTGGDARLLESVLADAILWPEMTLEGIRLSATWNR